MLCLYWEVMMKNNDLEQRVSKLERENKKILEFLKKTALSQEEIRKEIARIIKDDPKQEENEIVDDSGQAVFL